MHVVLSKLLYIPRGGRHRAFVGPNAAEKPGSMSSDSLRPTVSRPTLSPLHTVQLQGGAGEWYRKIGAICISVHHVSHPEQKKKTT